MVLICNAQGFLSIFNINDDFQYTLERFGTLGRRFIIYQI